MQSFLAFCGSIGWPGLALLAFVAATIVPIGSEWLLAIQLTNAATMHQQVFLVAIATLANTAGGLLTYAIGRAGVALSHRDLATRQPRVASLVRRYGALASLVGWVPFVGDPCTILCGVFRVRLGWFLVFSFVGRLGRYVVIWVGVRGML
jgi:membrane protein YqaA with SNARE-associated domain